MFLDTKVECISLLHLCIKINYILSSYKESIPSLIVQHHNQLTEKIMCLFYWTLALCDYSNCVLFPFIAVSSGLDFNKKVTCYGRIQRECILCMHKRCKIFFSCLNVLFNICVLDTLFGLENIVMTTKQHLHGHAG